MKTINTTDATETQLDWLVAKCEGKNGVLHDDGITRCIVIAAASGVYKGTYKPTVNWAQGGPIIDRLGMGFLVNHNEHCPSGFRVIAFASGLHFGLAGPNHLVAAKRCYVASKLGDTVEVPEELA